MTVHQNSQVIRDQSAEAVEAARVAALAGNRNIQLPEEDTRKVELEAAKVVALARSLAAYAPDTVAVEAQKVVHEGWTVAMRASGLRER